MRKIIGGMMIAGIFLALVVMSVLSVGIAEALIEWLILIAVFGFIFLAIHLLHS